jgi:GNAT superfamily N-acetyltransferase
LGQYVPAAHDEYAGEIRLRIQWGKLLAILGRGRPIGFFSLDWVVPAWWVADEVASLYLGGMVISRSVRGRGVGSFAIEWCLAQAARLGRECVRCDCHADNARLCRYYEAQRFKARHRVMQRPGYQACLYERAVDPQGYESTDQDLKGNAESRAFAATQWPLLPLSRD